MNDFSSTYKVEDRGGRPALVNRATNVAVSLEILRLDYDGWLITDILYSLADRVCQLEREVSHLRGKVAREG